ncbi:MAG: hypothetical protein RLZZ306_1779 [Bacteroidota bacterium]|jgi:uncharacterized protein YpbB
MEQITLNIPDNKVSLFIQMIGDLDFVKIKERKKVSLEDELTPGQKKTWKTIKKGFEDLKMIEQGKMKTTSARDFLQELQNEGYL